jgi:hypothetical protein
MFSYKIMTCQHTSHYCFSFLKAKINIAGPSSRTVRRMNQDSEFTKGTEIQVYMLYIQYISSASTTLNVKLYYAIILHIHILQVGNNMSINLIISI